MARFGDYEYTQSSICVAAYFNGRLNNVVRLIDCRTDFNGAEHYEWVYKDGSLLNGEGKSRPANNPVTLYEPNMIRQMPAEGVEFVLVRWAPNWEGPRKPRVLDPFSNHYPQPRGMYEVIDCDDAYDEKGLRKALAAGWKYSGMPTQRVLVVYAKRNDGAYASVLLDRKDLEVAKGKIRLAADGPVTAERYWLGKDSIRFLQKREFHFQQDRVVYANAELPERDGIVLIRPLEDYAAQYVQWYFQGLDLAVKGVDTHTVSSIIETALNAPEKLDQYSGVKVGKDQIANLRNAIRRVAHPDEDRMTMLIHEVLREDGDFATRCRAEVTKGIDQELADKRKEIAGLEDVARQRAATNERLAAITEEMTAKRNDAQRLLDSRLREIEDAAARRQAAADERIGKSIRDAEARRDETVRQLERTRKGAESEIARLHAELDDAAAELERTKAARQEMLDRLDEDVLLKVGLRAVANRQNREPRTAAMPMPSLAAYPARREIDERGDMVAAVDANLCCFGVVATDEAQGASLLAKGLVASLSGTSLFAVDSTFSPAVANSLAYAMAGMPAKHASIPVDWNDAAALERMLADDPTPVVVLDNVFDTVNESLLFALARSAAGGSTDKVLVLPVGAYGNLRMVAGEVWDHVFYVPTEGAVPLPSAEPHRACRPAEPYRPGHAQADAVVGQASRLRTMGQGAGTLASFVVPAGIVEANYRERSIKAMIRWTLPHMALHALATRGSQSAAALLKKADAMYGDDVSDLARALLRRVPATRGNADGR